MSMYNIYYETQESASSCKISIYSEVGKYLMDYQLYELAISDEEFVRLIKTKYENFNIRYWENIYRASNNFIWIESICDVLNLDLSYVFRKAEERVHKNLTGIRVTWVCGHSGMMDISSEDKANLNNWLKNNIHLKECSTCRFIHKR